MLLQIGRPLIFFPCRELTHQGRLAREPQSPENHKALCTRTRHTARESALHKEPVSIQWSVGERVACAGREALSRHARELLHQAPNPKRIGVLSLHRVIAGVRLTGSDL